MDNENVEEDKLLDDESGEKQEHFAEITDIKSGIMKDIKTLVS